MAMPMGGRHALQARGCGVFVSPHRRAIIAYSVGGLPAVTFEPRLDGHVRHVAAFPAQIGGPRVSFSPQRDAFRVVLSSMDPVLSHV